MVKIQITDEVVSTRSGVKNGRPWSMRSQKALVSYGQETRECHWNIPDDVNHYPKGVYTIDIDKAFYFNQYGLALRGAPGLLPLKQS